MSVRTACRTTLSASVAPRSFANLPERVREHWSRRGPGRQVARAAPKFSRITARKAKSRRPAVAQAAPSFCSPASCSRDSSPRCFHPSRRWPRPTSPARRSSPTARSSMRTSCITCHGANLQGVSDRGPSLVGVGDAAVYFQVSSGRMPAARGEAQALASRRSSPRRRSTSSVRTSSPTVAARKLSTSVTPTATSRRTRPACPSSRRSPCAARTSAEAASCSG